MSKLPPVPPANRSPKGPGADPAPATGMQPETPNDPDETGRGANIRQNTTNQGNQQDR